MWIRRVAAWVLACGMVGVVGGCEGFAPGGGGPGPLGPEPEPEFPAASPAPTATTAPAASTSPRRAERAAILDPSQGRPVILTPGSQFYFLLRLGGGIGGEVVVQLSHALVPELEFALSIASEPVVLQRRFVSMAFGIPENVPSGLYDLVVRGRGREIRERRCVSIVAAYKTRFRFVHLSNMNIGDLSAPDFDDRLVEEINLLAPEFIVATGDYTEWARERDDASSWRRVLDFFAGFESPVYLLCGDRDHDASYTRHVVNTPVGTLDYGQVHGVLLFDHSLSPIDRDQLEFVRRDLDEHRAATFNFLATHSDHLRVLQQLTSADRLAEYLGSHRVKLLIAGGDTDRDLREQRDELNGLKGFHFVRTHASSASLRGGASGVSHYRVFEVDGDRVSYAYRSDTGPPGVQHSIPVGRLRVRYDPADGLATTVSATVQNGLNQSFENARVYLRVAKSGQVQPELAGGQLAQVLDAGSAWLCEVRLYIPDKGGTRVQATTAGGLPAPVPVGVELDGEPELRFTADRAPNGRKHFFSQNRLVLRLTNRSQSAVRASPVIRLNGQRLSTSAENVGWPIRFEPGEAVELPLRLFLKRLSEGPHLLQVFFVEDPLQRATLFPVVVRSAEAAASAPG